VGGVGGSGRGRGWLVWGVGGGARGGDRGGDVGCTVGGADIGRVAGGVDIGRTAGMKGEGGLGRGRLGRGGLGRGRETRAGMNCRVFMAGLKPPGITSPWTDRSALPSGRLESRLVGKSDVVGDGERERLGAGIVGEAE